MRKPFFITFCLLCLYVFAIGQTGDTLYFDKLWHPCKKEEAKYFRLIKNVDKLYQIQDFYINGVMQMQGLASSLDPEILDGECTYYYPNGVIKSKGVYKKGKSIGLWSYYNSKGKFTDNYNFELLVNQRANDSIQKLKNKIPISSLDKNFSFAVRGKAISFFAYEDIYFRTATLGVEFLMKGRHSLGVDYTYFRWRYEHDDTEDKPLTEMYVRREYIYFDYKYRIFSYRNFDYYFNLYDKIGTYRDWTEGVSEGYNYWEKPSVNNTTNGTFNQVGAGIGFKGYLSDRVYVDLSTNVGKLFSNNNTVTYDSLFVAEKKYNVKEDKNIFYIRLNLGYKLFIKKKKDQDVFYTN